MVTRSRFALHFSVISLCILLILLTACSSLPVGSGSQNTPTVGSGSQTTPTPGGSNISTPSSGKATPQTIPMPQTQTDCPASNTARAAVMRPLVLGSHPNLVYIYNEVPKNTSTAFGHLRRYDMTTGQKTELVTSGIDILQAQVSNDGQWVLFLSQPDPRGGSAVVMLQLVRMDGQGLQTLLCLPYNGSGGGPLGKPVISFQWSVDEQSVLLSDDTLDQTTNKATSTITLLNVSAGTLKPLFLDQADDLYTYSVVTWLDNTHAYIVKQGIEGPTPPETVFLMNTTTATSAQPGLVTILTSMTRFSDNSLDSSFDGTQLYSSYCLEAASPFNTNIQVGPATGGARHTIFQERPADCVQVLRAIEPDTLLLLVMVSNATGGSTQIWTMGLPGGAMHTLTTLTSALPGGSEQSYALNQSSQYPWSNVSRDGGTYALQEIDSTAQTQSIVIASLTGGKPATIATTNPGTSSVSLVGWTTM
jgi:hypothetical protein